jgi:UDP-glucose 4-epimerase
MSSTFWITGAYGFIGRHLAQYLAQQGHHVVGIGNGSWSETDANTWGVSCWFEGKINHANLDKLLTIQGKPDAIFHLAGGASVGESIGDPYHDFERTVLSAAKLLEWLRLNVTDVPLVVASSAAVYGAGHENQIPTDTKLNPYSPYGFHKMMMESLCKSYGERYGIRSVIVRLFSVYGAGLRKQLLWDICQRISHKTPLLTLGGTGNELRDWTEIRDVVRLLADAAILVGCHAPIVNGGSGKGTSIRGIANIMVAAWSTHTPIEFSGESRPGDPKNLVASPSEINGKTFSWRYNIHKAIPEYIDWFQKEIK